MAFQRTAGICLCLVVTTAIAYGQRQSDTTEVAPQARLRTTHSESGGRTVVVETVEGVDIEGRPAALEEVVTETTRTGDTTHTRQDLFQPSLDGRRQLAEASESRQDVGPNGSTRTVRSTWVPDVNGRAHLTSQLRTETRSLAPDVQRTDTTLLLPGINEPLRETLRTEHTARQISPEVVRHETTQLDRDIDGRWRPGEIRHREVRKIGASERVEEETIQRPDLNGNLSVQELNVTRTSGTKEQELVVIETYAEQTDVHSFNGRPPLSMRVRRTTTATANGGSYTVEEREERSPVSPNEPMRVVQRIVTTVSPSGRGEWVTEQRVFELDANGRLRLVGE